MSNKYNIKIDGYGSHIIAYALTEDQYQFWKDQSDSQYAGLLTGNHEHTNTDLDFTENKILDDIFPHIYETNLSVGKDITFYIPDAELEIFLDEHTDEFLDDITSEGGKIVNKSNYPEATHVLEVSHIYKGEFYNGWLYEMMSKSFDPLAFKFETMETLCGDTVLKSLTFYELDVEDNNKTVEKLKKTKYTIK